MSLKPLVDSFERTPAVPDLAARLPARGAALRLGGLPGSSAAVLVAWLIRSFPQRLLTVVAPTPADAERWLSVIASPPAPRFITATNGSTNPPRRRQLNSGMPSSA